MSTALVEQQSFALLIGLVQALVGRALRELFRVRWNSDGRSEWTNDRVAAQSFVRSAFRVFVLCVALCF